MAREERIAVAYAVAVAVDAGARPLKPKSGSVSARVARRP